MIIEINGEFFHKHETKNGIHGHLHPFYSIHKNTVTKYAHDISLLREVSLDLIKKWKLFQGE